MNKTLPYFNSIQAKLIGAFLFVVLVPLLSTTLYGNWITSEIIQGRVVEAARNDVRQHAQQVASFLDNIRGDILYLAHLDNLQNLVRATTHEDLSEAAKQQARLDNDFLLFSATRPAYYQIRYLDETGQEIVRINSDGQISRSTPPEELQNKAQRYYFTEASKLPQNAIYVSPLDLNREFGEIEIPYQPVVRYATPIYVDNDFQGIVIINIYAKSFLNMLNRENNDHQSIFVADQDGYYFAHTKSEYLWGGARDLNTGKSVWSEYPEGGFDILSGGEGTYTTKEETIVYTTVYPVAADQDHYWVLLHIEPSQSLFAPITSFRWAAALILVIASIFALVTTIILARQLTNPIYALQTGVERFGKGELEHPIEVQSRDEIGHLTQEFNRMAAAIQQNLTQLERLHEAGQNIITGLDRENTMREIIRAVQHIFDQVEFIAILDFQDAGGEAWDVLIEQGERRWTAHRETPFVQDLYRTVLTGHSGQRCQLPDSQGYLCCARLKISENRMGIIELYGADPFLNSPAAVRLLSTLTAEASIALENIRLYETLHEHQERLAELLEAVISAQEEERKIVAYDLHDGLIQTLVGARLHLHNFITLRERDAELAESALEAGNQQLAAAIAEGRRVIEGLRPNLLDSLGLSAALSELAQQVAAVSGWQLDLEMRPGDRHFPPAVEITTFRIVQEALTNVRKHAASAQVKLSLYTENGFLVATVQDWGAGFEPETAVQRKKCVGLTAMHERARLLNGVCEITSIPGEGTKVAVRLPLES